MGRWAYLTLHIPNAAILSHEPFRSTHFELFFQFGSETVVVHRPDLSVVPAKEDDLIPFCPENHDLM